VVQRVSRSERARQLATATVGYTSAALAASELISKLTTDANDFINAEPDAPIPDSIRQAVRLMNTPELEDCAAKISSGVARGVAGAASAVMGGGDGARDDEIENRGPSAAERVMDKLCDPRNWGVVSVVVGGVTRQTLETIIDVWKNARSTEDATSDAANGDSARPGTLESALEKALKLAASDDGRSVLLDVCSAFVSNAIGTYLDKTAGSNAFDDFFAAALAASNREAFGDIAGRVTGEAVRTVVEAVSPAAAAVSRGAAQQRRAAEEMHRAEEERAGRDTSEETSKDTDGVVDSTTESNGAGDGRRSFETLFPESPRDVFGVSDDSPASTATGDDSVDRGTRRRILTERKFAGRLSSLIPAPRRHQKRNGPEDSESAAVEAAAFASALLNDFAPRIFSAFASSEGRRLVADVAGTCAASATRSFVLSIRDAVFFVDARDREGRKSSFRGAYGYLHSISRAAFATIFVFWIVASALASVASVVQFFGWNTVTQHGVTPETGLLDFVNAEVLPEATAGNAAKGGWWG
jgi:hypothetical protein